jgi:hypothetical protein
MRAMQCTQFHAKSAKNNLKPMDFLKHNFYLKRREYMLILEGPQNISTIYMITCTNPCTSLVSCIEAIFSTSSYKDEVKQMS